MMSKTRHFRQSTDGGTTWSNPAPIQNDDTNLREVNLAFDANNKAHAVWRTTNQIWHAREDEWPASINSNLVVSATGELVRSPDIAIAPDNTLHVVWAQGDKDLSCLFDEWRRKLGNAQCPLFRNQAIRKSDVPDIVDRLGRQCSYCLGRKDHLAAASS